MRYFEYSEFDCPCKTCQANGEGKGEDEMNQDFLDMLDHARHLASRLKLTAAFAVLHTIEV